MITYEVWVSDKTARSNSSNSLRSLVDEPVPLINILFGIMDDRFKGEPKLIGIKYFKNLKEAALFKLANPIVVDLRKPKSD